MLQTTLVFLLGLCFSYWIHIFQCQLTPFQVSRYPSLNFLPEEYIVNLVDPSYTNQIFAKIAYFQTDPVNDAVLNVPSPCFQLPVNPIPTDLLGHCFSECTQYPIAGPCNSCVYQQLFCQTYANAFQGTFQQLVASHIAQPEYIYFNCTTLDPNWHYQVSTYDQYTLDSLGSTASLDFTYQPVCIASEMCFHSKGLPKSPWDGPNLQIQQSDKLFYCCRTATTSPTTYNVNYAYTCVTTLYDPAIPTAPRAEVTCSRTVTVNSNPPGVAAANARPILQWDQTQFNCIVQCVYPYFTDSVSLQDYDPQPTQIGCSPDDFQDLCTLNLQTFSGTVCSNAGENIESLFHYSITELTSIGFDATGLYYTLYPGIITPNIPLKSLFLSLTWTPCTNGQIGCTAYCHCWNGCPAHPQCNGHGTLWESPSLGIPDVCMCDPGWFGNTCTCQDGNQLCGCGARTSKCLDDLYFVAH